MISAARPLLAGTASAAIVSTAARSRAGERTPYGGRLVLHVPWPLAAIDPHRIDDATAALFGEALFDSLYARDETGALVPALAEDGPQPEGATLRVPLRTGVRFASGVDFGPRVAALSLARARAADAGAWLADIPAPRLDQNALVFMVRDAAKLVRALASPLVAIVPPRFSPDRPDGTGPLRADVGPSEIVFSRNVLAAQGPSFLDAVEARLAPDLITSLRAFESGADDIGWLGSFLHEPRQGAKSFDAGAVAWAILRTGHEARALDTPGMAQVLADGVPRAALASLVVGPLAGDGSGNPAQWTGPPCDLLVRDDAPWLAEVARSVAVALSSPSHEITSRPTSLVDLALRKASRAFSSCSMSRAPQARARSEHFSDWQRPTTQPQPLPSRDTLRAAS